MSNSVPPSGPSPAAPVAPAASAPIRTTVLPTPEAPALTQGQTLTARVVANANNQIVLQTDQGRISVQSQTPLPVGTTVTLQVNAAGPPLQITIQVQTGTQNGAGATLPNQSATPTGNAAAPAAANPVTTQVTQGSVLQATVTATRGSPATPAASSNAPPTAASTGASSGPATAVSGRPTLQNGASLTLRVLAAAPPAGVFQPPSATGGNAVLTATITGHTPAGNPIARIDGVELTLAATSPLPVGSRLSLELLTLQPALRASGNPLPAPIDPWQTLREVMAILQSGDAGMTRQAAEVMLPNVGPRLAPAMLFFLSAILTGDVRRVLGDDAHRLLSRSAPGLLDRLSGELSQMQRLASDSAGPDWRSFFIPINTGTGLEQVRFHLHKGEDESADGDDHSGVRFVIEVNMSRLGAFQFDGFARHEQVDLVVKTHNELPPDMQDDIRDIYTNTLSAMGFAGNVAFRVTPSFDTAPVESTLDRRSDVSV